MDNLTAQDKDGVNVQKRKGEEYFHVVVHVIQRISCSFSKILIIIPAFYYIRLFILLNLFIRYN